MEQTLAELMDADLERIGKTQEWLTPQLTDPEEPVLTNAAVSMWKKRNRAPAKRLKRMAQILDQELLLRGQKSMLAAAVEKGLFAGAEASGVSYSRKLPPPPSYQFLGTWASDTHAEPIDQIQRRLNRITKIMKQLPERQQLAFLDDVLAHLLDVIE